MGNTPLGARSDRKLQILTAARHLLAVQGYDRTTMADIAAEVGVVESALYRHFSSKRELFHASVRVFYEPILRDLEQAEQAISDPRELLRYIVHRHLRSYAEGPELNRLVVVHARQIEGTVDTEVKELNRQYTAVLLRAVEAGRQLGIFREDLDPRLVRDMIYGFIEHTWLRLESRGETLDVPSLTSEVLALIEPTLLAPTASSDDLRTEIQRLSDLLLANVTNDQSPPLAGHHDDL